jgi:hypothetical protein
MKRELESKQSRDNYDAISAKLFVGTALANSVMSGGTNTNDMESKRLREIRKLRAKLDNCRDALKATLENCASLPDSIVTKITIAIAQSYE